MAALLVAVLSACNGVQPVPVAGEPNQNPTTLTPLTPITPPPTVWLACAKEYAGCGFIGLRDVLGGKVIATKSFFGGFELCNADHMGIQITENLHLR